jgi:murein DD-endopeptidase MepM/ murein hydrolase activator NlpD
MARLRAPSPRRATLVACAPLALAALAACAGHRPAPAGAAPGHATVPPPAPLPLVSDDDREHVASRPLLVPVAGVRATRIADSYLDGRSGGRTHFAVDIMAPRGTPVLAADSGRIWRLRQGGIGGITVYALDPAERIVYYYAHLDRYHPRVVEGMTIARGDTLGFVGTTGNAPPDAPHLHFQVAMVGPDRRYWTGIPVDPLPYLRGAERTMLAARRVGDERAAPPASPAAGTETVVADALPALATMAPGPPRPAPRTGRRRARRGPPCRSPPT